jgi:hypothetical protein
MLKSARARRGKWTGPGGPVTAAGAGGVGTGVGTRDRTDRRCDRAGALAAGPSSGPAAPAAGRPGDWDARVRRSTDAGAIAELSSTPRS